MPPSKKPTLTSQVQALDEKVSYLEEFSEALYKFVSAQHKLIMTMEKLIDKLTSSGNCPADDWRKQGEALLEQDEKNRHCELIMKRLQEAKSQLLELMLDVALAKRKPPESDTSNEAG